MDRCELLRLKPIKGKIPLPQYGINIAGSHKSELHLTRMGWGG